MKSHYHTLKTWPEDFFAVVAGFKTFEARKADRKFVVGDYLLLQEFDPDAGYTGRVCSVAVTHMLSGGQFGIEPGNLVMSIVKSDLPLGMPQAA